jgi:hypothetical protein
VPATTSANWRSMREHDRVIVDDFQSPPRW